MQIKLIVKELPESYNVIKKWCGFELTAYNTLWTDLVSYAFRDWLLKHKNTDNWAKIPWKKAKVNFYLFFPDRIVRDKINYATGLKPALDALTKRHCGIIIDDRWRDIEDQYYLRYDKEHTKTEITIEERSIK